MRFTANTIVRHNETGLLGVNTCLSLFDPHEGNAPLVVSAGLSVYRTHVYLEWEVSLLALTSPRFLIYRESSMTGVILNVLGVSMEIRHVHVGHDTSYLYESHP